MADFHLNLVFLLLALSREHPLLTLMTAGIIIIMTMMTIPMMKMLTELISKNNANFFDK